jgi:hypothetical protein
MGGQDWVIVGRAFYFGRRIRDGVAVCDLEDAMRDWILVSLLLYIGLVSLFDQVCDGIVEAKCNISQSNK